MFAKICSIILFSFIIFFGASSATCAQGYIEMPDPGAVEDTTVSTASIYNAKIVSQENNIFKISFGLSNRAIVQPGVVYTAFLVKKGDSLNNKIGEKIYSEAVDLGENQTLPKEITYETPSDLVGTFQLWLSVQNKDGLMIAINSLGEVGLGNSLIEQYGPYGLAPVILLAIIGLAIFFFKKKRKATVISLFFLLLLGGFFLNSNVAKADQASQFDINVALGAYATINIDKGVYAPGGDYEGGLGGYSS